MADSRHRQVARSARRLTGTTRLLLPAVGLLTVVAAGAAVVVHEEGPSADTAVPIADLFSVASGPQKSTAAPQPNASQKPIEAAPRSEVVSRSAERAPLPNEAAAEAKIEGERFAVASLEIHADAKGSSPVLAEVASGDTVDITGVKDGEWAQIIHKGLPRWVEAKRIASEMPLGTTPCASGSAPENGLRPDTIKVHRAVCAKFPSIATYGGLANRGEHATGQAIDIMTAGNTAIGYQIADFVRANAAKLGISQVIWYQKIWTVQRSGDGWRPMSSRGGATANHMDHVHVTTYGSAAR